MTEEAKAAWRVSQRRFAFARQALKTDAARKEWYALCEIYVRNHASIFWDSDEHWAELRLESGVTITVHDE